MSKPAKHQNREQLIQELAEVKAENKFIRQSRNIHAVVSVGNNLIRYGALVGIFYLIYLSVGELAGKVTLADIGIKVLADVKISEAVAWLFGGSGVLYGWNQRRLRRKTVEHIQTRNIALEQLVDPDRSSSELTPRGETNPRDN